MHIWPAPLRRVLVLTAFTGLVTGLVLPVHAAWLDTWTVRDSGVTSPLFGIGRTDANQYVAVGVGADSSTILLSDNGATWTPLPTVLDYYGYPLIDPLRGVATANHTVVLAGIDVIVAGPTDTPSAWAVVNEHNYFVFDVVARPDPPLFVAVPPPIYSTDGATWIEGNSDFDSIYDLMGSPTATAGLSRLVTAASSRLLTTAPRGRSGWRLD